MSLYKEANLLLKLVDTEKLALKAFSTNEELITKLKSLDVIDLFPSGRGQAVRKGTHFDSYVERKFNGDLAAFVAIDNRGDSLLATGDDKAKRVAPQKGLFLWSNQDIAVSEGCTINNKEGVVTFIHDRIEVSLPKDVQIVGVENFESLTYAPRLIEAFDLFLDKKILFVYRNASLYRLINEIRNPVTYLPDYDIFGIKIYETEILKYNPLAIMGIPLGIERILGSIKTEKKYLDQSMMKGGDYTPKTSVGIHVWSLLKHHRKIIPQEYFHASESK